MQIHVVSDGETPARIASKYGVNSATLIALNPHKPWYWAGDVPTFETLEIEERLWVPDRIMRGLGQQQALASVINTPDDAVAQAGGASIATIQNSSQVQGHAAQGQQIYTQANQLAAAGTGAANGDLGAVVTYGTLLSNNVAPTQSQQFVQTALAKTAVIEGVAITAVSWASSASIGLISTALAAELSTAIPVVGAVVSVIMIAALVLLKEFGASSPTVATPAIVQAMYNLPIPSPASASANEPAVNDASAATACPSNPSGGVALAQWRAFLDAVRRGTANNALPDPYEGGFAPSTSSATWQEWATAEGMCVATALGGQPNANAALALALRWVPFGDEDFAPYADGFGQFPAGSIGTGYAGGPEGATAGYTFQQQLISMAYALAGWPQAQADQQALQYLLTLAWIWDNYPDTPPAVITRQPLPGWLSYKIGQLQALVSLNQHIAGAVNVVTAGGATSSSTATTVAGTAAAVTGVAIAGVAIQSLVLGVGFLQALKYIWDGLKKFEEKHL